MTKNAKVTINPDYKIGDVGSKMYGAFLEPIRDWVYGGIYNPNHPEADDMGFRKDIIKAVKEFDMPTVRLPGGNFVSGWNWKDSIGPLKDRKAHLDLAWRQYEPNIIGYDEYIEWSKRSSVEPMVTLNMGTADINSAVECVEYSNHKGGTYWSDLRKKNGYKNEYNIKTWYLGNEMDGPWQINSWEKDPKGYGIKVRETSKAIKWLDPRAETVVCGTSSPFLHTHPQWDVDVLEQCYELVDYLSLHYYHQAPVDSIEAFLNGSTVFEEFINTEIALCDYLKSKLRMDKTMMISFDEYGCSFNEQGETYTGLKGRIPLTSYGEFSESNLNRDFIYNDPNGTEHHDFDRKNHKEMFSALTQASIIMTFLRHADRVKIACMTGGIRGAIAFDKDNVWKAATYYPYYYLNKYGRGISLLPVVDGPKFNAKGYNLNEFFQNKAYQDVESIEVAAILNEEKEEVAIFVINRDINTDISIDLNVKGFEGYELNEHVELFSENMDAKNTHKEEIIKPKINSDTKLDDGVVKMNTKRLSWNMLRLSKK